MYKKVPDTQQLQSTIATFPKNLNEGTQNFYF